MRRETGVKGWTEKRASEGDHRPSSWSKTQEELLGFKEERKRGVGAVDIAFPLGDYKKKNLRGGCKDDGSVARVSEEAQKGWKQRRRRELDYVSRKSSRGELREPGKLFSVKERDDARKKKRKFGEGKLLLFFTAAEGGAREIKRAKSGRGRVRM